MCETELLAIVPDGGTIFHKNKEKKNSFYTCMNEVHGIWDLTNNIYYSVTETIIFALVEADLLRNAWLAVAISNIYNIIMRLINEPKFQQQPIITNVKCQKKTMNEWANYFLIKICIHFK